MPLKGGGLGPSSAALNNVLIKNFFDETTNLNPDEMGRFKSWANQYNIKDVTPEGNIYPGSHYDMPGYFKENQGPLGLGPAHVPGVHFPDTYKQHGHPTFSGESQYARPGEGGMWVGDTLMQQPRMAISHKRR